MANHEYAQNMGALGHDMAGQTTEPETMNSLATFTNIAAAALSLSLIAGVGVWGYKLMMRDVSGIPVVLAAEGDMRVRPKDPGGQLAEHQGLAVNEIAARGKAAGPVDQVRLAPPAVVLAVEDQPVRAPEAPPQRPAEVPAHSNDIAPVAPGTKQAAVQDIPKDAQKSDIDQVVADLMAEIEPASARSSLVQMEGAETVQATPVAARAEDRLAAQPAVLADRSRVSLISAPGIKHSMRPKLRPEDRSATTQPASFAKPEASPEIDPSEIPQGTRLAQLGAFDSADVARSEWMRMQNRFGEILVGKSRVVQQAQSGGRTFYRLRAMGFVDLSDARRFCSALTAEGVECIPVQVR